MHGPGTLQRSAARVSLLHYSTDWVPFGDGIEAEVAYDHGFTGWCRSEGSGLSHSILSGMH